MQTVPKYVTWHQRRGPEVSRIADEQRIRLVRLRKALTPSQSDAARAGGVTRDAWHRMELGRNRINAVALAKFGAAYELPTEYVISGRVVGLPEPLARLILAAEARDAAEGREQVAKYEQEQVAKSGGMTEPQDYGNPHSSPRKSSLCMPTR